MSHRPDPVSAAPPGFWAVTKFRRAGNADARAARASLRASLAVLGVRTVEVLRSDGNVALFRDGEEALSEKGLIERQLGRGQIRGAKRNRS